MPKPLSLEGQKFYALTVIQRTGTKWGHSLWRCRCDCGNYCERTAAQLKLNEHTSCGCKTKDAQRETHTIHGLTRTRLYRIWKGMKTRCNNDNQPCFKYYGGKGIKVCKLWANDFHQFYEWSIKNGYSEALTIDRIDSNKDYEPSNCRWVDMTTQNRNKKGVL